MLPNTFSQHVYGHEFMAAKMTMQQKLLAKYRFLSDYIHHISQTPLHWVWPVKVRSDWYYCNLSP